KFNGKDDEGFFVRYFMNSKAFRVFNSRTRIVEETLHINFLENKPNVAGSGTTWLFDINRLTKSINYKPVVAGNQSNGSAGEEEKKDSEDLMNEDNEVLSTKEPRVNQKKDANINNINNINTVSLTANAASIKNNIVVEDIVYGCADDPNMPNLEEIVYLDDDAGVGAEADITNFDTNIPISPILTTRIHKDHSVKQIFRDLHLAPQTRRMTQNVTNYAGHWNKIDLQKKKDERGIRVRNKPRLVAQGYTQKEGIDYDEAFALVAKIDAIRMFLAYTSFKDFVMYQMDMKSAFMYDKIEEEVYVCQPQGFEDQSSLSEFIRKSTIGGCQFLRSRLISWQSKKQTVVANSNTEAEHVAASNCGGHTSVPTKVVVNEAVYEEMYDSVERATTTATDLDAEQDRGIISKTQFTITLNEPSSIETSSGSGTRRQKTIGDAAAQTRNDQEMFYTCVLDDEEVVAKKVVSTADLVTTVGKVVTTAGVEVSATATTPTISMDDITLTKALAALKSAKSMVKESSVHVSAASTSPKVSVVTQLQAKLEEEDRLARQKEEEANIALIAKCDDVQAMMDADHELVERTKALKKFKKAFDNIMSWINSFVPIDKEVIKGSKTRVEGKSKRAREELESDKSKRQKLDEKVEAKVDNDQEEAENKIIKEGKISSYHIVRHDESSKRYSSMIQMLHYIDREDMEISRKKRYPLTPATITEMLNRKLQADHWNEMCYQLLKLMLKQQKKK
nr:retrovirus-related Pol polyprotein from transposon TNT 1-94 [Tanacetum cinerariifolium]